MTNSYAGAGAPQALVDYALFLDRYLGTVHAWAFLSANGFEGAVIFALLSAPHRGDVPSPSCLRHNQGGGLGA